MSMQNKDIQEQGDESSITKCKFDERQVGKAIKSSKRRLRWEFEIKGKLHSVELYDSKLSGKKKVVANGATIFGPQVVRSLFTVSFYLDSTVVSLVQNGNSYECRVNNFPFNHLIELQRNKQVFSKDTTSPICNSVKRNTSIVNHEFSKFHINSISNDNENKENANENKQFKFAIKERSNTGNSTEGSENRVGANGSVNNNSNQNKYENFINKIAEKNDSKVDAGVNLLDFGTIPDGTKPTKFNILDLFPDSPKKEKDDKVVEGKELIPVFVGNDNNNEKSDEKKQKTNINDLNDIFDNFNFTQQREPSTLDKLKESYQSSFVENEAAKIDSIYNVFGSMSTTPPSTGFNFPKQSLSSGNLPTMPANNMGMFNPSSNNANIPSNKPSSFYPTFEDFTPKPNISTSTKTIPTVNPEKKTDFLDFFN